MRGIFITHFMSKGGANSRDSLFQVNTVYGDYSLKQDNTVESLGCYLDSNINGESMAHKVFKKINTKLNFLWRQSNY